VIRRIGRIEATKVASRAYCLIRTESVQAPLAASERAFAALKRKLPAGESAARCPLQESPFRAN